MSQFPEDPRQPLTFALEKYPEKVDAIPVDKLLLDSARQNAKRPAYVKLAVPDDVVKELRGSADRRQRLFFLVSVPQEVLERSESRIVLPGEF